MSPEWIERSVYYKEPTLKSPMRGWYMVPGPPWAGGSQRLWWVHLADKNGRRQTCFLEEDKVLNYCICLPLSACGVFPHRLS